MRTQFLIRRIADQDRHTIGLGELGETRGNIDVIANHSKVHPLFRTDIARNHLTRTDAHTDHNRLESISLPFLVHPG